MNCLLQLQLSMHTENMCTESYYHIIHTYMESILQCFQVVANLYGGYSMIDIGKFSVESCIGSFILSKNLNQLFCDLVARVQY